jgi:ABC-type phosphate/phosphonate transport system permease subunit
VANLHGSDVEHILRKFFKVFLRIKDVNVKHPAVLGALGQGLINGE